METMRRSQQHYLLFLSFLGMVLVALSFSYRGFLLPTFKAEFQIDNTRMGIAISVAQLSSLFFAYYGGVYCLRFGQKRIAAAGCILMAAAMVLMGLAQDWIMLLVSLCFLNCGSTLLVLGLNTLLPIITLYSQAILMNVVHGVYGLGSTVSQKGLAWYISSDYSWRALVLGTAAAFAAQAVLMLLAPGGGAQGESAPKAALPYRRFSMLFIGAISFYVIAEFLLGSWIINYFQEGYAYSATQAAFYSTLFFATFTLGRLGGGFIMQRVKRLYSIIVCMVLATISVLAGQLLEGPFFVLIGISGLFFSVVYPTAVTIANEVYDRQGPYFIGISSMATSILVFVINVTFGYLNDILGVVRTFYGVPACLLVSTLLFAGVLAERRKLPPKAQTLEAPEAPSFCQTVE